MNQLSQQKSLIENLSSDQEKVSAYVVAGRIWNIWIPPRVYILIFIGVTSSEHATGQRRAGSIPAPSS